MSSEAAENPPPPPVENGPTTITSATKPRSCVVCRSRKVRCDKRSPCSNCRRANIPCILPSTNRTPRWVKNYNAAAGERSAQADDSSSTQLMERLRNFENLVKDLRSQLDQAQAAAGSSPDSTQRHEGAESPNPEPANIQSLLGRLVINDDSNSRYVSSRFWSRVNDELDEIKKDIQDLADVDLAEEHDEGQDRPPATNELERTPSERNGFFFRHYFNAPELDPTEFQPLPSQVPFLLDVFAANINVAISIVHMPTIRRIARSAGADGVSPSHANDALLFSIYYAAIVSMEEDDVMRNFRTTKADLSLKYRFGFERAMAKADFMNVLDIVVLQALCVFLFLARRHDSPRFVWMMTGLAIRMAQGLGLQRDGTHFQHLTPFEVETRRRVWYAICALDIRASEDQGTEFTIQYGSFDTELPKNINDADIDIDTKLAPKEREGITDSTTGIITVETSNITRRMMLPGVSIDEQRELLYKIYDSLEQRYHRFSSGPGDVIYRVLLLVTHLLSAKLTLLAHLPILFSSPSDQFSDDLRNELLLAALAVAETNHALNAERAFRQWRWIFQTYTHWHAVVYLFLEICRRPWSPIVERAWIALHSPWLIPARSKLLKDMRTWVPVRQLMLKARRHREAELERLRGDVDTARRLEVEDRNIRVPPTLAGVFSDSTGEVFRGRWCELVGLSGVCTSAPLDMPTSSVPEPLSSIQMPRAPYLDMNTAVRTSVYPQPGYPGPVQNPATESYFPLRSSLPLTTHDTMMQGQFGSWAPNNSNSVSEHTANWFDGQARDNGQDAWFWADVNPPGGAFDMNLMDTDFGQAGDMDWHSWVESAKDAEMDRQANTIESSAERGGNF
ncbi:hypothetical protein GGR50DRAFT_647922 [Xylaria sp. CBS 124048]|nr:hypothetical protein GGR50DRAFT_647922 [Xylaria sp. CBS 124048]